MAAGFTGGIVNQTVCTWCPSDPRGHNLLTSFLSFVAFCSNGRVLFVLSRKTLSPFAFRGHITME